MENKKMFKDKNRVSRDSGICVDESGDRNLKNSAEVASIASRGRNKVSYVKKITNQFELLARQVQEQESSDNENENDPSEKMSEISIECVVSDNEVNKIEMSDKIISDKITSSADNEPESDFEEGDEARDDESEGAAMVNEVRNLNINVDPPDSCYTDSFTSSDVEQDDEYSGKDIISANTGKIMNIMKELLDNEERYVQTLDTGISNYVNFMSEKDLPPSLVGQKYNIFGNIERIYDFHKTEFQPRLEVNCCSIEGIAEAFIDCVDHDNFYGYILFAMNKPKSLKMWEDNKDIQEIFQKRQEAVGDKLGLNSFLLQPIQRLPRYKLLINEIIKELLKLDDIEDKKKQIGTLCKAEKKLMKLIDTLNESMSINDIIDCYEINLLHQGQFKKMHELDMYDWELRRKYHGKMFLFEKCIVYTEQTSKKKLEYRGHYMNYEIGFHNDGKNKLILFSLKRGQQEIEVTSNDVNEIQRLAYLIETVLKNFGIEEKIKIKQQALMKQETMNKTLSSRASGRSSVFSRSSTSTTSSSDRDSLENSQTKCEDLEIVKTLISSQKHFCQQMEGSRKHYIDELPSDLRIKLKDFTLIYGRIVQIHAEIIYPDLLEKGRNVDQICELFIQYFKGNLFNVYSDYIQIFKRASKVLNNIYRSSQTENISNYILPNVESFLFCPIEQLHKINTFFSTILKKYSDFIKENIPIDKDLFRKIAFVEVQVNSFYKNTKENYKLFNLDEKISVKLMGPVVHSEKIILNNEDSWGHRLFITEMGIICIKIEVILNYDQKVSENYLGIVFYEKFYGYRQAIHVRDSKKSSRRLNFFIADRKFAVDFKNTSCKNSFYEKYFKYCNMMLIKRRK